MKKYFRLVVFLVLALMAGPLIPAPALCAVTNAGSIPAGITAIVSDGTYNFIGTWSGKVYQQTVADNTISSTVIASVPGAVSALSLVGTTLYITTSNGKIYGLASASAGTTSPQTTLRTDGVVYIGPAQVTGYVSTWTLTKESSGIQSLVRTADNTVGVIEVDITAAMRSATSKGMKLTSVQYAFGIGVATPTDHTLAVLKTTFGDNTAPSVANVLAATAIYKTYGTVTSPYIRTATISTPPWEIPFPTGATNNKYLIEITLDASGTASTTYRFYGLWLVFTYDNL